MAPTWSTYRTMVQKLAQKAQSEKCKNVKTFDSPLKFIGSKFEVASLSWSGVRTTDSSARREMGCSVLVTTSNSGPIVSNITWKMNIKENMWEIGKKTRTEYLTHTKRNSNMLKIHDTHINLLEPKQMASMWKAYRTKLLGTLDSYL